MSNSQLLPPAAATGSQPALAAAAVPHLSPPSWTQRVGSFLFSSAYAVVWLATTVCVVATAVDVYLQTLDGDKGSGYRFTVIGSYALMAVASMVFAFSRYMTIRGALSELPKEYVPVGKMDVPPRVYALVNGDLARSAEILARCKPHHQHHQHHHHRQAGAEHEEEEAHDGSVRAGASGWGAPGSALDGTHFRGSMVASLKLLEQQVGARTAAAHQDVLLLLLRNGQGARQWMQRLVDQRWVDGRLAEMYVSGYESARWSDEQQRTISEREYLDFMRVLTAIVANLPPPASS
ncbi:hypothetical protein RI367_003951 [Sorochytrium milnesiophthora]